mmetsp:Transcript_22661/g.39096  ORF Transcript_22661/g.39096 Transcript_22661/m.39096 type:complete len:217 (+) Transcript_22661:94-744(+)
MTTIGVDGHNPEQVEKLMSHFEKQLRELFDVVAEDSEHWEFVKEADEIKVFRNRHLGALHVYRSRGVVKIAADEIVKLCWDFPNRPKWDPVNERATVLQEFSQDMACVSLKFSGLAVISSRELVGVFQKIKSEADGSTLIVFTSVDRTDGMQDAGVLATSDLCGMMFRPCKDNSDWCELEYIGRVNPNGWIPTWATNLGSIKGAWSIDWYRKYFHV